jgi:hypothetical protein
MLNTILGRDGNGVFLVRLTMQDVAHILKYVENMCDAATTKN